MGYSIYIEGVRVALGRYLERTQVPTRYWNAVESSFLNSFQDGWAEIQREGGRGLENILVNILSTLRVRTVVFIQEKGPEGGPQFDYGTVFAEALGTVIAAREFYRSRYLALTYQNKLYHTLVLEALNDKPEFLDVVVKEIRPKKFSFFDLWK